MPMKFDEVSAIALKFAEDMDPQIAKRLQDAVEVVVFKDHAHGLACLPDMVEDPPTAFPHDCKGAFIGEPAEIDPESDDTEEEQIEFDPEGYIVLFADQFETPQEVGLVLMHELAHALGLDEQAVADLGLGLEGGTPHETPPPPNQPQGSP